MTRKALLASSWYPRDSYSCKQQIADIQNEITRDSTSNPAPGLLAPHAGWHFSGRAMVRGFASLATVYGDAELVVVFGSHRGPNGPNTLFRGDAWDTPLGPLKVDSEIASDVAAILGDGVGPIALRTEPEEPSRPDNGAEVLMPLCRHFFPKARLLMLGVASSTVALEIGRMVGEICVKRSHNTVVIGSSDLTHYGDNFAFSPMGHGAEAVEWVRNTNDAGFLDRVLRADSAAVISHAADNSSACCPGSVAASLEATRVLAAKQRHKLRPQLVDHYLSADIMPAGNGASMESFVGYGAVLY